MLRDGDVEASRAALLEAGSVARALGSPFTLATALNGQASLAVVTGDDDTALERLTEAVDLAADIGTTWTLAYSLPALAALAARRGQAELAARLFAAGAQSASGTVAYPPHPDAARTWLAAVRAELGEEAFAQALGTRPGHAARRRPHACRSDQAAPRTFVTYLRYRGRNTIRVEHPDGRRHARVELRGLVRGRLLEDHPEQQRQLGLAHARDPVLADLVPLRLRDVPRRERKDLALLLPEVLGEGLVQGVEDRRDLLGDRRPGLGLPATQRGVQPLGVVLDAFVLLLHPVHERGVGRAALEELGPQQQVLAGVVQVQSLQERAGRASRRRRRGRCRRPGRPGRAGEQGELATEGAVHDVHVVDVGRGRVRGVRHAVETVPAPPPVPPTAVPRHPHSWAARSRSGRRPHHRKSGSRG